MRTLALALVCALMLVMLPRLVFAAPPADLGLEAEPAAAPTVLQAGRAAS